MERIKRTKKMRKESNDIIDSKKIIQEIVTINVKQYFKNKWNEQQKRQLQASFTVEASFLFPIIFIIIFSLFYVVYYEHDKVRAEVLSFEQAREEQQELEHEKIGIKLEKEKIGFQRIFLLRKECALNEKNKLFIKETIRLKGNCSIGYLDSWLKAIGLEFCREFRIPIYNPMELLRLKDCVLEQKEINKELDKEEKKVEQIKELIK